jgi:hypothetical protein
VPQEHGNYERREVITKRKARQGKAYYYKNMDIPLVTNGDNLTVRKFI